MTMFQVVDIGTNKLIVLVVCCMDGTVIAWIYKHNTVCVQASLKGKRSGLLDIDCISPFQHFLKMEEPRIFGRKRFDISVTVKHFSHFKTVGEMTICTIIILHFHHFHRFRVISIGNDIDFVVHFTILCMAKAKQQQGEPTYNIWIIAELGNLNCFAPARQLAMLDILLFLES